MHAGERYKLKEFLFWTHRDSVWLLVLNHVDIYYKERFT